MSTSADTPPDQNTGPPYDRDAIIKSITRYYELLSKMVAIRPKQIQYPPAGGWDSSTIPLSKLQRLGFNDRAIDLIQHLPYVTDNRPVYPGSECIVYFDWALGEPEENYQREDPASVELWPVPDQRIPEGVVPLSRPYMGDPGYTWWILETGTGELLLLERLRGRSGLLLS
jgi:hypothetical protein